jgi:hypothetical protein
MIRVDLSHPIISLEQAKADGLSASQIRTIARSLERISRWGYPAEGEFQKTGYAHGGFCDAQTNRRNAARLRALARSM